MLVAIFIIDIIGALYFIARMMEAKTNMQKIAFPTLVVISIISAIVIFTKLI